MDFTWAIQKLKEGKKVRRKTHTGDDYYITYYFGIFKNMNGVNRHFYMDDFEATDWELYDETKEETLSDKINFALYSKYNRDLIIMGNPTKDNIEKYTQEGFIDVEDVKEAIRKLLDIDSENDGSYNNLVNKIKEIFGDKLI